MAAKNLIPGILSTFAFCLLWMNTAGGTDLSASYISCRLILTESSQHLYAHDPRFFNVVSDPVWQETAAAGRLPAGTLLSPFVQTPLWPVALQPLCRNADFPAFNRMFAVMLAASFTGILWVTGRFWAPRMFTPVWMAAMAVLWLKADPLHDAVMLTQTHAIFLLLALLAIVLARSGREWTAGLLLAVAATVKITPAVLALYWLMTRQRRAALSFLLGFGLFSAVTFAVVGEDVARSYVQNLARVSNVLLLSDNNQSFAAWCLGRHHPASFATLVLPLGMKVLCSVLLISCTVAGGYWDRRLAVEEKDAPPLGAVFALLGATVFTPIAWSHYSILLVVPLMLLVDDALRRQAWRMLWPAAAIFALANSRVLLRQAVHLHLPQMTMVRGQFYADMLAMVALFVLYRRRKTEAVSSTQWAEEELVFLDRTKQETLPRAA